MVILSASVPSWVGLVAVLAFIGIQVVAGVLCGWWRDGIPPTDRRFWQ